jgi:hypothetical protein
MIEAVKGHWRRRADIDSTGRRCFGLVGVAGLNRADAEADVGDEERVFDEAGLKRWGVVADGRGQVNPNDGEGVHPL